jgi:phosphatidylserine/phosphatidylglycerophosphate/cardiolipin synthase-like enzyme
MDESPRPEPRPAGRAGGMAWGPSLGLLAIAVGIVFGALAWWWTSSPSPAPVAEARSATPSALPVAASAPALVAAAPVAAAASSPAPALQPRAEPPATPAISRNRDPNGDQTPDLSDYVNPGERPTMAHVIERLHQAGVHTGLGAFSPPGTRPPLLGLAVPEDFVLPEGYVRHHQATDDGQRIEAILMFAPDRQFFDAAGRPVDIPKDRVVPPELAPPGLPIRRIAVPPPIEPGRPGR